MVAPSVQWSYEDGASASDAQIYGAVAIASKVFSPTLTLGIGEATAIPLFLRISRDFTPKTRLDFYAIALVNGKLTLKSPGGDDVVSENYKTAPALALSLRHRF